MTIEEALEIERIWELERSRKKWPVDSLEIDSAAIGIGGLKDFFLHVFNSYDSVVLLADYTNGLRETLTLKTATKMQRFSDVILLFNDDGLLLCKYPIPN